MPDSEQPPKKVPSHKETVQGIGAPANTSPTAQRDSGDVTRSKRTPTDPNAEAEVAFLAFLDASEKPYKSERPSASGTHETQVEPTTTSPPRDPRPRSESDRPSAPTRPPAPRERVSATQLAGFAAVVAGALAGGYLLGKASPPEPAKTWSPPSSTTPSPLVPCIPTPTIDIDATPVEEDPVDGEASASTTASGSAHASAAPSSPRAHPTTSTSAHASASATSRAEPSATSKDPSSVF